MKPLFNFALSLFFALFIVSCGNSKNENDTVNADSTQVSSSDSLIIEETISDTLSESTEKEVNTGSEGIATEDEIITEKKVVEQTGMSFCDCVKKQKEIQQKIDNSEDDEELMQLMQEMNNLRNGDCKVLFIQDQTSVDQIEERKRRIAACK
jgi:hypothetical protein